MIRKVWGRVRPVLVYAVFLFVVVEGMLQLAAYIAAPDQPDQTEDGTSGMLQTFYYRDRVNWGEDYWREHSEVGNRYEHIIDYIYTEYHGEYVNIDVHPPGVFRRTWNPDSIPHADTLLVLGGSTAWGFGVRDNYTLPSELSRALNAQGHTAYVMNAAVNGFTFYQSVMRLSMLLREGFRPRYVVCYDGVNEVLGAHYQGGAGRFLLHRKMERIQTEKREAPTVWGVTKAALLENIITLRIVQRVYGVVLRFGTEDESADTAPQSTVPQEDPDRRLAREIVDEYGKTVGLLDRLSRAYGFRYTCFWQPSLFLESRVFPEEAEARRENTDQNYNNNAGLARIFPPTDSIAREYLSDTEHCYWIGDALANRERACYFDALHVTEEGNGIIARRMAEILETDMFGTE